MQSNKAEHYLLKNSVDEKIAQTNRNEQSSILFYDGMLVINEFFI
jgi:hypothetical protein